MNPALLAAQEAAAFVLFWTGLPARVWVGSSVKLSESVRPAT